MKNLTLGTVNANEVTFSIPSIPTLRIKGTLKDDGTIVKNIIEEPVHKKDTFCDILNNVAEERYRPIYCIIMYEILIILSSLPYIFFNFRTMPIIISWILTDMIYKNEFGKYMFSIIESYKSSKIKNIKGLHAACHMAYNAYEELGRVPNLEEIKHFSKYTEECSCAIKGKTFFIVSITAIVASMVPLQFTSEISILINVYIFLLVLIITLIILEKMVKKGINKYISFYSVRKPSDEELKLAIAVLSEIEKIEKNPQKVLKEEYNIDLNEKLKELLEKHHVVIV